MEDLGFVLGEALLEALDFGVEVLDETLLPFEQIQQLLGGKPPCLEVSSRFPCVHGKVLCRFRALPRAYNGRV